MDELKNKIQELEEKLKNSSNFVEEDLDSKDNFDMNCIYKIQTNGGYSLISTGVSLNTIQFNYSGTNYTTSSSNRRANTTGWTVTKMIKLKIW